MDDAKRTGSIGHHLVVGALVAASSLGSAEAVAADMFVKLGDIKGESQDSKHKDEIQVLSWSWGVSGQTAQTPQQGKSCAQPFVITKFVDKATPLLFVNTALNTTLPDATISVRTTDGSGMDFLVIKMRDVTITEVKSAAPLDGGDLMETVKLGFSSAAISFTPQADSGTPGAPIVVSLPSSCK